MEIKIRHAEKEDIASIKAIYEQPHAIEGTLQLPYPSVSIWESRFEKWGDNLQNFIAVVDENQRTDAQKLRHHHANHKADR